jgi:hypothetical protein
MSFEDHHHCSRTRHPCHPVVREQAETQKIILKPLRLQGVGIPLGMFDIATRLSIAAVAANTLVSRFTREPQSNGLAEGSGLF